MLKQEDNDFQQADSLATGGHQPYEINMKVDYVVQLAKASASVASAKGKTSKKESSKGGSGSSKAGSSGVTGHTAASGTTHHTQASSSKGKSGSSSKGSGSGHTTNTVASSSKGGSDTVDTGHTTALSSKGGSSSKGKLSKGASSSKGSSSKGGSSSSKGKTSKKSSSSKGNSASHSVPSESDSQDTVHTRQSQSTVHTVPSESTKHTVPSEDTVHTVPSESTKHTVPSSSKSTMHTVPTEDTVHTAPSQSTKHSSVKGSTGHSSTKGSTGGTHPSTKGSGSSSSKGKGKGGSSFSSSSKGKGNGVPVPSLTTIPSLDDEDDVPDTGDDTFIIIPNPDRAGLDNCLLNTVKVDGILNEVYECTAKQDYNFAQQWVTLNSTLTCPAEDVRNVGLVMASRDTNVGCECDTQRTTWVFWVLGIEDEINSMSCNCFACPPDTEIGMRGGFEYQCDSAITGQCLNFDCEGRCNGMNPSILPPIGGFLIPSPGPGTPTITTTPRPTPPPTDPARTVKSGIPSTHSLSWVVVALLVLKSIMR